MIRGIDHAARQEGYQILVSGSHADTITLVSAARSMHGLVEGLLIMAPDDGSAAVALRRTDAGSDVFIGPPRLTPEVLRALARLAGVHLFARVDCSVWAAEGIVSVHALTNGPLEIDVGRASKVTDALTGAEAGRGPKIVLPMEAGETRVLRF